TSIRRPHLAQQLRLEPVNRGKSLLGLAAAASIAVAGCGGSSSPAHKHTTTAAPVKPAVTTPAQPATAPITVNASFHVEQSLLGAASSAGTIPSYVPTGRIVADDGFRPDINGFGFENYGNDAGPVNLTPAQVEDLFGPQVCAAGTGAGCIL